MQAIIEKIAQSTGLESTVVENVLGTLLGFVKQNAPEGVVSTLLDNLPGASELIEASATASEGEGAGGGLFGGLMGAVGGLLGGSGGGIMALVSNMMSQGVSMDQMQSIGKELFAHLQENMGEEQTKEILAQIPGLKDYV